MPISFGATGHILRVFDRQAGERSAHDQAIHDRGFYISLGERDPDVASVAVPVLDEHGTAYGALSVSGLMSRYTEEKRLLALTHLKTEAANLSQLLKKHHAGI